jgi:hypothetical protein
MFGSFQATDTSSENTTEASKSHRPSVTRRITTSNACGTTDSGHHKSPDTDGAAGSCRRRKIRCDGASPCGQCKCRLHDTTGREQILNQFQASTIRYELSEMRVSSSLMLFRSKQMLVCTRSHRRVSCCPKSMPESVSIALKNQKLIRFRLVEDLSSSVEQYRSVFERLFPGRSVDQLAQLSKEDLIATIGIVPEPRDHPTRTSELGSPTSTLESEGADSLETLIQAPEQDPVADEATRHSSRIQGISDDVNGLSLSLDRPSSYVGVSSITAALKVICRVAPATRRLLGSGQPETTLPSRAESPSSGHINIDPGYFPPAALGQVLIETYFSKVHPLMPMLDEQQFWQTWLYGERKDHAWLALLNTVLALGSVMSSDCTSTDHEAYYQRAMRLLNFDSLGSGNTLVVQALGLLSGY